MRILQQEGSRPRWSPSGDQIVYDRVNPDGYFDVYLTDRFGGSPVSLTEGKPQIGDDNHGNADFDPSGNYIVFLSEEEDHFLDAPWLANPGIGLFSNFWAMDRGGQNFWQLTDIPIKRRLFDGIPSMAVVNPVFSDDGERFLWTERYDGGGNNNWGVWRLKTAGFDASGGGVRLAGERILFTPGGGTYVTAMGFIDPNTLLVAGNLDGQHEYSMDQYRLNLQNLAYQNLQSTESAWEEGACLSPNKKWIMYMSDLTSSYALDFDDAEWHLQPTEREYWLMASDGSQKERLTYLNDPNAPEYLGRRVIVAACDFSPDGRFVASTLGVDFGTAERADLQLKLMLIEFEDPELFAGGRPTITQNAIVNSASFEQGFAAGGWVTILGSNLAPTTRTWRESDFVDGQLPTSLDGVSVDIDDQPAYVFFISPAQLNVLAPDGLPEGPVEVSVRVSGTASEAQVATQRSFSPAFFTLPVENGKYVAAVHLDGALVARPGLFPASVPSRSARPGEILQVYGTGFGPTVQARPAGRLVESPSELRSNLRIWIGGVEADVAYAGLVGSGLYQFNVTVPDLPNGDQSVEAEVAGVRNQGSVLISVER